MRCCGSLCRTRAGYKAGLSSDQTAILDGCPMFAPAYMGRTRRGAASSSASAMRKNSSRTENRCPRSEALKKSFSAHVRWCEHGAPVERR